jgi:hypothetical protein
MIHKLGGRRARGRKVNSMGQHIPTSEQNSRVRHERAISEQTVDHQSFLNHLGDDADQFYGSSLYLLERSKSKGL